MGLNPSKMFNRSLAFDSDNLLPSSGHKHNTINTETNQIYIPPPGSKTCQLHSLIHFIYMLVLQHVLAKPEKKHLFTTY